MALSGRGLMVLSVFALLFPAAAEAADKVVFQLGWLPGGHRAPPYVGIQRGFFAEENLEVEVLSGRGAADVMTKLATGVADFGESTLDALLDARAKADMPVTAVMAMYTKQPDALLTTTTSGLDSLKSVAGKRVASSPFTASNLPWPFVLKSNGIDPESVRLIKADAAVLPGMLAAGQTDAIIQWVTSASAVNAVLNQAGKSVKVIAWTDYGYEGYSQSVLVSNRTLAQRPDVARRFMKGITRAIKFMSENPEQTAADVSKSVPQLDPKIVRAEVDAVFPFMFNEISRRDGLGVFNPERVQTTWKWVAQAAGHPMDKIDPMSVISKQFVTN